MTSLAALFKALSDESRLRILNLLLLGGELCVCDIEAILGSTQTKVSRHLAYLRRVRLVEQRRQGLWRHYSLARPQTKDHARVLEALDAVLRHHAAALRDRQRLTARIGAGCCVSASVSTSPSSPPRQRQPRRIPWTVTP